MLRRRQADRRGLGRAAGLYQVGSFPARLGGVERPLPRRRAPLLARRRRHGRDFAAASRRQRRPLRPRRGAGPQPSVNFVTCHDGFTLPTWSRYNDKHNEANGEDNRDGDDDNRSWNCGAEGPTDDPDVARPARAPDAQLPRHAAALAGRADAAGAATSCGRTQRGNNNAYCQDNEISWFDWSAGAAPTRCCLSCRP